MSRKRKSGANGRSIRLTLLTGLLLVANPAFAGTIRVAGRELPTRTIGGVDYVQLGRLAAAFGGRHWSVNGRYIVVLPGTDSGPGEEYVFRPDTTLVLHGTNPVQLIARPVVDSGVLLLPVVVLPGLFPDWNGAVLRRAETGVRGDTVVVTLGIEGARPGDSVPLRGERPSSLEYRLSLGARAESDFTSQVRLIGITGAGPLKGISVDSGAGTRLCLSFRRPSGVRTVNRSGAVEVLVWPLPERRVNRIVLDPGHGGSDPGAVGANGTQEQEVTWDIVRRLKRRLQDAGYEVLVTRDSCQFVALSERSKLAAQTKADVFVSIHANASPNREANGFEVYFLSEARTDWERAVAARENAVVELEVDSSARLGDDLQLILADLAQNEHLHESSELAQRIQAATINHARLLDRGVRQAGFYVLRNTFCPAVLVEVGFLSNRSEEKLLRRADHREKLAEGIYRGLVEFCRQYQQRVNGS